ncbi:MAG: hypothetical protein ACYTGF_17225, partial [Planctomycetota bacterium]
MNIDTSFTSSCRAGQTTSPSLAWSRPWKDLADDLVLVLQKPVAQQDLDVGRHATGHAPPGGEDLPGVREQGERRSPHLVPAGAVRDHVGEVPVGAAAVRIHVQAQITRHKLQ